MNLKVIIPAHLASLRLKEKILIDIHGLPMIEHVRRRVLLSKEVSEVIVATCDFEIKKIVEGFGGKVVMTSNDHQNGTSRVAEAVSKIKCSHVLIVQGDEPLIHPEHINLMVKSMLNNDKIKIWNGITSINSIDDLNNRDLVKCFVNSKNQIGMCFRNNPGFSGLKKLNKSIFKIQGLIAFKKNFLMNLVNKPPSPYELAESIEQMRSIENGNQIQAVMLNKSFSSINNLEELKEVRNILKKSKLEIEILNTIKHN